MPGELRLLTRVPKLSQKQLAIVRKVLIADPALRAQISGAATSALVDDIGLAWLAGKSVESSDGPRTSGGGHVDRRRTIGAEQRADRLERDLASLAAKFDRASTELADVRARLKATHEQAIQDAAAAQVDRDDLCAALEAERSTARQRAAQHAELVSDLDATRDHLAQVIQARDNALASLSQRSVVAPDEFAELASTSGVKRPAAKRMPLAIPGGFMGDSADAGEYLLRVPGASVLVDGYNVSKLRWPELELGRQRSALVGLLEALAARWGTSITVVFDGDDSSKSAGKLGRLVRVLFSPTGISADDVIRAEISHAPTHVQFVIVTNDRAILRDARRAGANVLPSSILIDLAVR